LASIVTVQRLIKSVAVVALLILSGWVAFRTWPRRLHLTAEPLPSVRLERDRMVVPFPTRILLAEVGRFEEELPAYLWFDYLRSRPGIDATQVLLVVNENQSGPVYRIEFELPNDAITAIPFMADLKAKGWIEDFDLVFTVPAELDYRRQQTSIFVAAYQRPVDRKLESLPRNQLMYSAAHFLSFKSRTDPRVRASSGSGPASLTREQASELAADIIAVADFLHLPLDVFLGIGAMENNYLNIRGDLNHDIWKKSAAKDDIILKRRRNKVLVSNYSIGVWQITRETLRYAHALYLQDARDYERLPERLRPPKALELDLTNSHVLTTYAGLLLRDLLDRFNGDVGKAVGAYNGGPRNPNAHYAAGVQMVADYARNVLERVKAVNGEAASDDLEQAIDPRPE